MNTQNELAAFAAIRKIVSRALKSNGLAGKHRRDEGFAACYHNGFIFACSAAYRLSADMTDVKVAVYTVPSLAVAGDTACHPVAHCRYGADPALGDYIDGCGPLSIQVNPDFLDRLADLRAA